MSLLCKSLPGEEISDPALGEDASQREPRQQRPIGIFSGSCFAGRTGAGQKDRHKSDHHHHSIQRGLAAGAASG